MNRRHRAKFHEPSLVPLADMLTNTVGIMVFILIFTVLTAGGVVLVKRLPVEHSTDALPFHFLCEGHRVLPLDASALIEEFSKPLGKPGSYGAVEGWLKKFNSREISNEFFVIKGEGESHYSEDWFSRSVSLELVATFTAREGTGFDLADLGRPDSRFREILKKVRPAERFVHFFVRPDSLDVFFKARSIAMDEMGFGSGWLPLGPEAGIRFSLSGGGSIEPLEQ